MATTRTTSSWAFAGECTINPAQAAAYEFRAVQPDCVNNPPASFQPAQCSAPDAPTVRSRSRAVTRGRPNRPTRPQRRVEWNITGRVPGPTR
jgi:hypothetical protein